MDDGDRTLEAYERGAEAYLAAQHPAAGDVLDWIDRFAALLRPGARVLEIGSGPGTDAVLLEERSLAVQRSDATSAFADRLRAEGRDVLDLDVRRDPIPAGFDAVFANAVLLHLDRDELADALGRIGSAIGTGGVLACTVKEGDGEEWSSRKLGLPRRFTYWRSGGLRSVLERSGFDVVDLRRSHGSLDDWLQVLARVRD